MRFRLACAGVLFALSLASARAQRQQPNYTLRLGFAGALRVGMRADEVIALFGKDRVSEVDLKLEGGPSLAFEIRLGDPSSGPSLVAQLVSQAGIPVGQREVWRIQVFDERFKTADGLGVGSTFGEIRNRRAVGISRGEEGCFCAFVRDLGTTFRFTSSDFDSGGIAPTARATSLFIWGHPADALLTIPLPGR